MGFLYIALVCALFSCLLYYLSGIGRRPKNYPPGPPTWPILGNIHLMPTENPHLQFGKWAHEYGSIYSLMLGTKTMIVLSSDRAVRDVLDKKSSNTSSRPDLYTGHTLLSGEKRMSMMTYGSLWRTTRRLFHHALHVNKSKAYAPYEELENKQLLYELMTDSSDLLGHFRRYSSSLITSIVYGFRWPSFQDPLLQILYKNMDKYVSINPTGGAALADFYPILRYLPAWPSSNKRAALQLYNYATNVYTEIYRQVKASLLTDPEIRPCVCRDVIALQAKEGYTDEYASYIPAQLWEAGSDTTSTELYGFVQALLLYPEVQIKGQAELDAVIGQDRMPTLDDMPHLPYVRACVKETLRWLPTATLGAFPHAAIEGDTYMGYRIPAGAGIMLNTWTIHRDPMRYENPSVFNPERYIGDTKSSTESANCIDVSRRDHFGFGAGRRICPGMNVTDSSMMLVIARIFWAFDVGSKLGSGGEARKPIQDDFWPGFVVVPKPFDAVFIPRSDKKRGIVESAWKEAKETLGSDGQFLKGAVKIQSNIR